MYAIMYSIINLYQEKSEHSGKILSFGVLVGEIVDELFHRMNVVVTELPGNLSK